jgi:hypothetical protein
LTCYIALCPMYMKPINQGSQFVTPQGPPDRPNQAVECVGLHA